MLKEQELFLNALRDHLKSQQTLEINNVDFSNLLAIAQQHQMSAIVFYQCKHFICDKRWESEYYSTISTGVARYKAYNRIHTVLKEKNINHLWFKGIIIASFYPVYQLRTMGDIDLLVDNLADTDKTFEIIGAVPLRRPIGSDWAYSFKNFEIEVHDKLIYDEDINIDLVTDYFNQKSKECLLNGELDVNFHFMFLIVHLRKHLMNSGVGFRQFYDIAVLVLNCKELNWGYIEEELEKLNLLRFTRTVLSLNEKCFGVCSPLCSLELTKSFYENVTQTIFSNGVFGFDNESNNDYLAVNKIRRFKFKKIGMLISALKTIFPSCSDLVTTRRYAFLKDKHYLLPYAWIIHWIRGILHGRISEAKTKLKKCFVSKEYIKSRNDYFEEWGL